MEPTKLWDPPAELVERSNLRRFEAWLETERDLRFDDYDALWRWSTEDLEGFWSAIWEFFDVRSETPYERVLSDASMPGAKWFEGARLNYAEHAFRGKADDALAIIAASEIRDQHEVTWGELREQVSAIAEGLRKLGVEPGDRVVGYLPNIPETIAVFLAVASLGAVWSSCSPDFGARSVVDRFSQIEPKVLFAVDGYGYNGKSFDRMDTVAKLEAEMPSLERTVIVPYLDADPDIGDRMPFAELLESGKGAELRFEAVAFDHPLWVLYSSGTTGLPKAIVQGQGGILLEHLKMLHLHVDAHEGDRLFWFTTTGWMMWNFLVAGLLTDATILLYDGNPAYPSLEVLWDFAADTQMTCFGTSASYIASCMKAELEPAKGRDLSHLRSIGSTGSPLAPEGFEWVYDQLGGHIWLFSTSGGTDVCSAFVGGVPILPVYRGELQARALGAKVESFDPDGNPVIDEVGELVLTAPLPSMPLYLWNDPDGERYHDSYFDMYEGIWRHGDWIRITDRGTSIIYGRSDSTINRGGVRMGTSEIYSAVLAVDDVVDALVVDVEGWMPLFVVLRDGAELDDDLVKAIRTRIREDCSPRHVPNDIFEVGEIPRTLSNKVLEVPVKRILAGATPDDVVSADSLQNPKALDYFAELAASRAS
jgi:acetoacetyl-CoA synthetase